MWKTWEKQDAACFLAMEKTAIRGGQTMDKLGKDLLAGFFFVLRLIFSNIQVLLSHILNGFSRTKRRRRTLFTVANTAQKKLCPLSAVSTGGLFHRLWKTQSEKRPTFFEARIKTVHRGCG